MGSRIILLTESCVHLYMRMSEGCQDYMYEGGTFFQNGNFFVYIVSLIVLMFICIMTVY